MTKTAPKLVILMPVPAHEPQPGVVLLTRKAWEGALKLAEFWGGPVHYVAPPGSGPTGNLDDACFDRESLPYRIHVLPLDSPKVLELIADASIVLGGPQQALNDVPARCAELGIPYVHTAEYTWETRRQIIRTRTANPLLRARRYLWEARQELANLRVVRSSVGVQCNGTPTYDAYKAHNPETLLFFDSRVSASMVASSKAVYEKLHARQAGDPIRLAFSGRFIAMKGVDHLPLVAKQLDKLGVPFEFHLCGGGDLEPTVRALVAKLGLDEKVRFHGVLDYQSELVPFVRDNIDLFVACHRQGDPSCTYLETFACGVPVVGYDNEALRGLSTLTESAWTTPLDRPEQLARRIAELYEGASELEHASLSALDFARAHTFEKTFARRVHQLGRLSRVKPALTRMLANHLEFA